MLTAHLVRAALADKRPRKLFDRGGLYLLMQPSGSKLWRFKFRFGGVEKLISLGAYPEVSLKQARDKRDAARRALAAGQNPSSGRQAAKELHSNSFEQIAHEYLAEQAKIHKEVTIHDANWRLEPFLLPSLGQRPIAAIESPELLPHRH